MPRLYTKRGYQLLDVASALQKSIRRADTKLAGYWAQELVASNYHNYVWKRLLTISAEDCHGLITDEIHSLYQSFLFINKGQPKGKIKGRIFISKAVIVLCSAPKSRDADALQCLVYDKKIGLTDEQLEKDIQETDAMLPEELPDYVFDVHTFQGKRSGKTKKDFFAEEYDALQPKQKGLFDNYHKLF